MTPQAGEARSLIVPVCLSASHIAFGSIRMEPIYMVLGETCGLAAVEAIDKHAGCVQDVDAGVVMSRFAERDRTENPTGDTASRCPDIYDNYFANLQRAKDLATGARQAE